MLQFSFRQSLFSTEKVLLTMSTETELPVRVVVRDASVHFMKMAASSCFYEGLWAFVPDLRTRAPCLCLDPALPGGLCLSSREG